MEEGNIVLPLNLTQLKYSNLEIYQENIIGRGRYSTLCKAKCDELTCAAKYYKFEGIKLTDEVLVNLEMECQLASSMRHPCIIQCLGTVRHSEKDRPIMLMELMDENLTQFLQRKKPFLPLFTKLNICHDIACALAYLHNNGIVHGNLTSNNVLMVGETRAKITDFWMLKIFHLMEPSSVKMERKHFYVPPESLKSPPKINKKSDVFSFGGLVIQVDTCTPEISDRKEAIEQIKDSDFKPLVLDCLKDDYRKRPELGDLCSELDALKAKGAKERIKVTCAPEIKESIEDSDSKSLVLKFLEDNYGKQPEFGDLCVKLDELKTKKEERIKDTMERKLHCTIKRLNAAESEKEENISIVKRLILKNEDLQRRVTLLATLQSQPTTLQMMEPITTSLGNMALDSDSIDYAATPESHHSLLTLPVSSLTHHVIQSSHADPLLEHRCGLISQEDLQLSDKPLGQGNIGTVYSATWHGKHQVAFKKLSNQNRTDKWKMSLECEAIELCKLVHPNVVKIYGVTLKTGSIGVVMEIMQCNLYDAIFNKERDFTEIKKIRIIRQIAYGLDYLHKQQIVHCNLKTAYIFLSHQNSNDIIAKISNYAPKCTRLNSYSSYDLIGEFTPCYAAPEILRDDFIPLEQLKQADVYSLAIVAYEVLVKKKVYTGVISVQQLEKCIKRGTYPPPLWKSNLSQEVTDIVIKCWNYKAEERYTTEEFIRKWKGIKSLY